MLEHAPWHDPQFAASVKRLVSQPFAALPSQFPKPGLQTMPHTPERQTPLPLVELHTRPHAPQFSASLLIAVSQPSSMAPGRGPLQSRKPGLQV